MNDAAFDSTAERAFVTDTVRDIRRVTEAVGKRETRLLSDVRAATLDATDRERRVRLLNETLALIELEDPLDEAIRLGERFVGRGMRTATGVPVFEISSLFLKEALERLVPAEQMFLAAGKADGRERSIERVVEVALDDRTQVHVSGDPDDVGHKIQLIGQFGSAVTAWFHSHPGGGPPSPSSIDWNQQKLFERAYKLVGVVATADGFFRFFSTAPFEVKVHGKLVEEVPGQPNVFRLCYRENGTPAPAG